MIYCYSHISHESCLNVSRRIVTRATITAMVRKVLIAVKTPMKVVDFTI